MKFTVSTLRHSLIVLGLLSAFTANTAANAEEPKPFDYNQPTAVNYVNNAPASRVNAPASRVSQKSRVSGDLFSKGYYLGGSIGQSEASSYCDGASACENNDTAWKMFGGMQVMNYLSVEGTYLNLGDIRKNGQNSDVTAIAAYGVGTLPVISKFDAFAKLGAARWSSENTDGKQNGFGVAYGLGAKMALNNTTKLRAEWEKVNGVKTSKTEKSDMSMLSVGVEISTF